MFTDPYWPYMIQHNATPGVSHAWPDASDARAPCDQVWVFLWMLMADDKWERTVMVIMTFLSVSLKRIRNSLSVIIVMSKLHKKSIYPFLDFYQKHRWDIIHWPALLGSPTAGCRLDKALRTWAQKTIWVPTQRDGAPKSDTGLSYLQTLEVKITWPSPMSDQEAQEVKTWKLIPSKFPLYTLPTVNRISQFHPG